MTDYNAPFITLGKHLKYVREQLDLSIAEVSGAVEIDEPTLERIESGLERPAEEILLLLISHFGVQDQEAVQLWELAGYESDTPDQLKPNFEVQPGTKTAIMLLAMDTRTLYSDAISISTNKAGVTLSFQQDNGQPQPNVISRIGMSFDQAQHVAVELQKALIQARNSRSLPSGQNTAQRDV